MLCWCCCVARLCGELLFILTRPSFSRLCPSQHLVPTAAGKIAPTDAESAEQAQLRQMLCCGLGEEGVDVGNVLTLHSDPLRAALLADSRTGQEKWSQFHRIIIARLRPGSSRTQSRFDAVAACPPIGLLRGGGNSDDGLISTNNSPLLF